MGDGFNLLILFCWLWKCVDFARQQECLVMLLKTIIGFAKGGFVGLLGNGLGRE